MSNFLDKKMMPFLKISTFFNSFCIFFTNFV